MAQSANADRRILMHTQMVYCLLVIANLSILTCLSTRKGAQAQDTGLSRTTKDSGWARTWGGDQDMLLDGVIDTGTALAIGPDGSVYVTGAFAGTVDFDPGEDRREYTADGLRDDLFLSKYDSQGQFVWARAWGSGSWDSSNGVAIDGDGFIYVTGSVSGPVDFDPGPGSNIQSLAESPSEPAAFLSKFTPEGALVWAQEWRGDEYAHAAGLSVIADDFGNIYVLGSFGGTARFGSGPRGEQITARGFRTEPNSYGSVTIHDPVDVFLCKYSDEGEFQWVRTWGGEADDGGACLALDRENNVLASGYFSDVCNFGPAWKPDNRASNGASDAYTCAYDSTGESRWAVTWGGVGDDSAVGITVDTSNSVYVAGDFADTVDFCPGPQTAEFIASGHGAAFLSKFSSTGDWRWTRTWGARNQDHNAVMACCSVATDLANGVFVVGGFSGEGSFDLGSGSYTYQPLGGNDSFLTKFDSNGIYLWSRVWGGESSATEPDGSYKTFDGAYWVGCDSNGSIVVTGTYTGTVDFDPTENVDEHSANEMDVFLIKFLPDGNW